MRMGIHFLDERLRPTLDPFQTKFADIEEGSSIRLYVCCHDLMKRVRDRSVARASQGDAFISNSSMLAERHPFNGLVQIDDRMLEDDAQTLLGVLSSFPLEQDIKICVRLCPPASPHSLLEYDYRAHTLSFFSDGLGGIPAVALPHWTKLSLSAIVGHSFSYIQADAHRGH